jgi:hypothetical protein
VSYIKGLSLNLFNNLQKIPITSRYAMISRRPPRKPDLFVVMLLVVAFGLSATVAYQVNLYYNNNDLSLARQAQNLLPAAGG